MIEISKEDYEEYITPEIEARIESEIPPFLDGGVRFDQRQRKLNDYIKAAKKRKAESSSSSDSGTIVSRGTENNAAAAVQSTPEPVEAQESDYPEEVVPEPSDDIGAADNNADAETAKEQQEPVVQTRPQTVRKSASKSVAKKPAPKAASSKKSESASSRRSNPNNTYVHDLPKSVLNAIRRHLPDNGGSNADLISAFVYIFTDGECEIPESAMEIVNNYESDDKIVNLQEQMRAMASVLRRHTLLLQSIELCTCYETFDRRFGADARRTTPKEMDFREKGNLDMLAVLRRQAKDQSNSDSLERGRQIYNQTKDIKKK